VSRWLDISVQTICDCRFLMYICYEWLQHAKPMLLVTYHNCLWTCVTGTTWLQQIVWLIMKGLNAESDGLNMEQRFPYIEYEYPGLSEIGKMRSPRLIKSHLPYSCLPVGVEAGHGKVKALISDELYFLSQWWLLSQEMHKKLVKIWCDF